LHGAWARQRICLFSLFSSELERTQIYNAMAVNFVYPTPHHPAAAYAAAAYSISERTGSYNHQLINYEANVLRLIREYEGRCPLCGAQTHQLHYIPPNKRMRVGEKGSSAPSPESVTVYKEPLTVDKYVYQGRCLLCHPFTTGFHNIIPNYGNVSGASHQQQPPPQQATPDAIQEDNGKQEQDTHACEQQINTSDDITDDNDEILDILCRMRENKTNLSVQISSFHALWVLSWDTDNARAIGRVGGIPILIESLRYHLQSHLHINNRYNRNNHRRSPSSGQQMQLQSNGLETLQNLSVNKLNKELLMSSISNDEEQNGFISLLLMTMSTFLHDADIQRSGCGVLANILTNGRCFKQNLLSIGSLEAVNKSVRMHNDNKGVVRAAYKCLHLLGQKPNFSREKEFAHLDQGYCTDIELSSHGSCESSQDTNADAAFLLEQDNDGAFFILDDMDGSVKSLDSAIFEEL